MPELRDFAPPGMDPGQKMMRKYHLRSTRIQLFKWLANSKQIPSVLRLQLPHTWGVTKHCRRSSLPEGGDCPSLWVARGTTKTSNP